MVPTEAGDRIDDLVDFLQRSSAEFLEVGFDFLVIHAGGVVVGLVQQVLDVFWGWLTAGW